jgi:hypothetical protein
MEARWLTGALVVALGCSTPTSPRLVEGDVGAPESASMGSRESAPPEPRKPRAIGGRYRVARLDVDDPLQHEVGMLAGVVAAAEYEVADETVTVRLGEWEEQLTLRFERDGVTAVVALSPRR